MSVEKERFGFLADGREVFRFAIENKNGMRAIVTNYGAILIKLFIRDKEKNMQDVVLGYDKLENYFDNNPMFGATVGRNVNRVRHARFSIDDKTYYLKKNRGNHNIHSDKECGFHKVLWNYKIVDAQTVEFSYISPDGELGFPGTLEVKAVYTMTQEDKLIIKYRAVSDKKTLINMSNHTYFNLSGTGKEDILDTKIKINAEYYTPIDKEILPTGEILCVKDSPMDFREKKSIKSALETSFPQLDLQNGFDHNYVLMDSDCGIRKIAEAECECSGIHMEVYSNMPGMQFYTGNSLKNEAGKRERRYGKWSGFCMEPQYFPDSINISSFPTPLFSQGEEYQNTIIYRFI